jgi:CheY-like chemotaxis protein
VVHRALAGEGWDVWEAADGRLGLEKLREAAAAPELILLDLMMPEMDGFAFLEALRREPAWQAIPVVVITAMALTNEDLARLNGGVQAIVQKSSCSPERLVEYLRGLVAPPVGASESLP